MVLLNLTPRNQYHKNGTQFIGRLASRLMGERHYEAFRMEKRIFYAKFWYSKQTILFRFQTQYPNIAQIFSLLNKQDTTAGFPAKRQYERHQDFAIFNINNEGWFQLWFFAAAAFVLLWNWWMLGFYYEVRGVNVEDEDLYRWKDYRVTTNFDRTKYQFNFYFFAPHMNSVFRREAANKDFMDDPRFNYKAQLNIKNPYGLDRYMNYYGYSTNMRYV